MSLVDDAYKEATQRWNKSRRQGWLSNHLKSNTKGKKASKEAYITGYVTAVLKTKGEIA
jgi:hypothetical protein